MNKSKRIKKKKILIVDDDAFLTKMYASKFSKAGFEIFLAFDGEKGLAIAKEHIPDIIILDILLPEMDGYEVLARLKKNSLTQSIPVVMLTNFFQKEDIKKCLKAGANDYLIKSHFMPSEVLDKINKIID